MELFCTSEDASEQGMGLIEVIISLAIISIIAFGAASIFQVFHQQIKMLNLKYEQVELKNMLIQTMSKSDVCSWQFKDKVLDLTATTPTVESPTVVDFEKIYQGTTASSAVLLGTGQLFSSSAHGLIIDKITFSNVIFTGYANEYRGLLRIHFDDSNASGSLREVVHPVTVVVNPADPIQARRITQCLGPLSGSIGIGEYEKLITNHVYIAPSDGFVMMQIGGNGASDNHGYICAGTDFSKVSECYGSTGGGPGTATILTRAIGFSGSSAMVKKGHYYQVQGFDPSGDGGSTLGYFLPLGQ